MADPQRAMTRALALALALCAAGSAWAGEPMITGIIPRGSGTVTGTASGLLISPPDMKPGDVLIVGGDGVLRAVPTPTCEADGVQWPARVEGSRITCYMADRPKPGSLAQ